MLVWTMSKLWEQIDKCLPMLTSPTFQAKTNPMIHPTARVDKLSTMLLQCQSCPSTYTDDGMSSRSQCHASQTLHLLRVITQVRSQRARLNSNIRQVNHNATDSHTLLFSLSKNATGVQLVLVGINGRFTYHLDLGWLGNSKIVALSLEQPPQKRRDNYTLRYRGWQPNPQGKSYLN